MNGPEHYAEAERLLAIAADPGANDRPEVQVFRTQQAQVHATLALTAATLSAPSIGLDPEDPGAVALAEAWSDVAG